MGRIEQSIEVNAPKGLCFEQWSRFEEFPRFMDNVERIQQKGATNLWEWEVKGPLGKNVTWDAEMDAKRQNQVISWHTRKDSEVENAGAVTFDELAPDRTRVNVRMDFEPPAGLLGEAVAAIFKNPEHMVKEDLKNFKSLIEERRPAASTAGRTSADLNPKLDSMAQPERPGRY